jgi:serine/threonine protein kinase
MSLELSASSVLTDVPEDRVAVDDSEGGRLGGGSSAVVVKAEMRPKAGDKIDESVRELAARHDNYFSYRDPVDNSLLPWEGPYGIRQLVERWTQKEAPLFRSIGPHRNVAHPVGVVWRDYDGKQHRVPYYVLYRRAQGTLQDYLFPAGGRPVLGPTVGYLNDVLAGLEHLSKTTVVHRDVKPENILLYSTKGDSYAAIGDFDCSRRAGANPTRGIGTKRIAAPETRLRDTVVVTPQADMWSFGCLCLTARWALQRFSDPLASADPLDTLSDEVFEHHGYANSTQQHIDACLDGVFGRLKPPVDETLISEKWIRQCLMIDPTARPAAVSMSLSSPNTVSSQLLVNMALVQTDPTRASSWYRLGTSLRSDQHVDMFGERASRTSCFVKALSLDRTIADAWLCLGFGLTAQQVVQVAGKDYTKQACYLEALKLDPTYSKAWNNLGHTMSAQQVVQVAGKDYTKEACFVEAERLNPTLHSRGCSLM